MNTLSKIEKADRRHDFIYSLFKPTRAVARKVNDWLCRRNRRKLEQIEWDDTRTTSLIDRNIHKWVYHHTDYTPDGEIKYNYLIVYHDDFYLNRVYPWDKMYFKKFANKIFHEIFDKYEIPNTEKYASSYDGNVYFHIKES